jgi:hypothetical protein
MRPASANVVAPSAAGRRPSGNQFCDHACAFLSAPLEAAMIANQRSLFDIPHDIAYFNCASLAPLMCSATEAGRKARPTAIFSLVRPKFRMMSKSMLERH